MEKTKTNWYAKFVHSQKNIGSGWLENKEENYPAAIDFLIEQSRNMKPKPLGLFFEAGIREFFGAADIAKPKTKEDKKLISCGSEWAREQWEKHIVVRHTGSSEVGDLDEEAGA